MGSASKSLSRFTEEIQAAEYRQATETFSRLVAEETEPLPRAIGAAVGAAAPFVQVPSHLLPPPGGAGGALAMSLPR